MLLTSLAEYSHRRSADVLPPGCEKKTVKWIIPLDRAGNLIGEFEPTAGPSNVNRGGKQFIVPRRPCKPALTARALVDKASYVLGIHDEKRRHNHANKCQLSFLKEAESCARATRLPCVRAICAFLKGWKAARGMVASGLEPHDIITFRVGGVYPILLPQIRKYWSKRLAETVEPAGEQALCLVCGQFRSRAKLFPQKLTRLRQGHASGMNLLSLHGTAFESYGQKGALAIPICSHCGEAATRAANALLDDSRNTVTFGRVSYIFWTSEPVSFDFRAVLVKPRPEEIRALLQGQIYGSDTDLLDKTAFQTAALSANTGRVVVRDWMGCTIGEAIAHLQRFYSLQFELEPTHDPLPLLTLVMAAADRDGNLPTDVGDALFHCAVAGKPLPRWLLWHLLQLNREARFVSRPRAALIHICLFYGREAMLERCRNEPSFRCGTLIAVLEIIQWKAIGDVNVSLTDRLFAAASITPGRVFPQLLRTAQAHLHKLRRDQPKAFYALRNELQQMLESLTEFPAYLSLHDQGLFALGYYQYKAARQAALRKRGQQRPRRCAASNETVEEVEAI